MYRWHPKCIDGIQTPPLRKAHDRQKELVQIQGTTRQPSGKCGEVLSNSGRHRTIEPSSFDGAGERTVLSHLLAPPLPLAGIPVPTLKSMLIFLLLDPPPPPPLHPLLIQGDLRCSLMLLVPGPSESHVRTGKRRRVTFVGIFNSGENKQIELELNVKGS